MTTVTTLPNVSTWNFNSIIPEELKVRIIDFCSLAAHGALSRLNKDWEARLNNSCLWKKAIYHELTFNNSNWIEQFDDTIIKKNDEDFNALPTSEIIEQCKCLKLKYPDESVRDLFSAFWMPELVNKQLTVEIFGKQLLKTKFPCTDSGYEEIDGDVFKEFENHPIESGYWVFMIHKLSLTKCQVTREEIKGLINEHAKMRLFNYKVSNVGQTMIGLFTIHLKTNKWPFEDPSKSYILCCEQFGNWTVSIGIGKKEKSLDLIALGDIDVDEDIEQADYQETSDLTAGIVLVKTIKTKLIDTLPPNRSLNKLLQPKFQKKHLTL